MLDAIAEIGSFDPPYTKETFERNSMLRAAIAMMLGVIGESANGVSTEVREAHPEIPWRDIIGMRNRVIHDYFGLRTDVIDQVIVVHLPMLEDQLLELLKDLPDHPPMDLPVR